MGIFLRLQVYFKGKLVHSNRESHQSDKDTYLKNLHLCFSVVSKKMKDNSTAIIFFKDSKPENIYLFIEQMQNCGLQFIKTCHVQKKKYTYKQKYNSKIYCEWRVFIFL